MIRPAPKRFSIRSILPSVVTLLAFIMGLTAIRFALAEKWELAVAAIVLAGVFDGLDGTVARLLKSTSRFGAELDSLSDVVAFGVAPPVVLYLWALDQLDRLGWAIALIFAAGMALRLARFNAKMDDEEDHHKRLGYLTGVPAPAGAALLLVPIMLDFVLPANAFATFGGGIMLQTSPMLVAPYAVAIAVLMVSTVPTMSLKTVRVPRAWLPPLLLVLTALIAGLFVHVWLVLLIIAGGYLISIPITVFSYRQRVASKNLGRKSAG